MVLLRSIYLTLTSGIERLKYQGEVISEVLDELKYVTLSSAWYGASQTGTQAQTSTNKAFCICWPVPANPVATTAAVSS